MLLFMVFGKMKHELLNQLKVGDIRVKSQDMNLSSEIDFLNGNETLSWRSLSLCSSAKARELISYELARELQVLPLAIRDFLGKSDLLLAVPNNVNELDLRSKLKLVTDLNFELYKIDQTTLRKALVSAYRSSEFKEVSKKYKNQELSKPILRHLTVSLDDKSDSTVPDLLKTILNRAYQLTASDIHLVSQEDENIKVLFRIDGRVVSQKDIFISSSLFIRLTRHIKVLSGLDITENVAPQDGMFSFSFGELNIRVRLSIIPNIFGFKIALRLLYHPILDEIESLDNEILSNLGLLKSQSNIFLRSLKKKGGLILLSGPTGSGKSTLLYSLLLEALREDKNIISVEDPVERNVKGITQIEVSEHEKRSYHEIFKTLLRQDPDIIVISEIRDKKAAEISIQAALSGCLVLSTIHASNVIELVLRLFEFSCSPVALGSCLKVISSQRLIPANCPKCIRDIDNNENYGRFFDLHQNIIFKQSLGCPNCFNTGVKGRKAIFETCEPNLALISELSDMYSSGLNKSNYRNLRDLLRESNYVPFLGPLQNLLISGEISPEEALCLNL